MGDTPAKLHRRWLSFSLRSLLAAITALAIGLGLWVNSARQQRAAVAGIKQASADAGGVDVDVGIYYDYQIIKLDDRSGFHYPFDDAGIAINYRAEPPAPAWLRAWLGVDFVQDVVAVCLDYAPENPDVLAHVARLSNVEHLVIEDDVTSRRRPGDGGISHLRSLVRLRTLEIGDCSALTDDSLQTVGRLRRLEVLKLLDCEFTDRGLAHLQNLVRLKLLRISCVDDESAGHITDAGLAHLAGLIELEHLHINSNAVTDAGLRSLAAMQKLNWLTLDSPLITDDGLRFLAGLASLESIELVNTKLDGTGLKHLASHHKLKSLNLYGAPVVDEGVTCIASLPCLESVSLCNTRVTAAGLCEFKNCPTLKTLYVSPDVPGDIKRLQEVLAPCAVQVVTGAAVF